MKKRKNRKMELRPLFHEMRKMELNLTCTLCRNLFCEPIRLPCDHILCRKCVTAKCPLCALSFLNKDIVHSDFTESMLTIFKNMEVSFTPIAQVLGIEFVASGKRVRSEEIPVLGNNRIGKKARSVEIPVLGNGRVGTEIPFMASSALGNNIIDIEDSEGSDPLEISGKNAIAEATSVSKGSQADQTNNESERLCADAGALNSVTDTFIVEATNQQLENSRHLETKSVVKCAFCHMSRITEYTGQMLHYVNENPAHGVGNRADVKHFHLKCFEWAPRGYFEGEKAKNLEVELARASGIRCHKCRKKGAALGCNVETCVRSYHVPCAVALPRCRWDQENFVMLCPSHSMHVLPCDSISKVKWLTKGRRSKTIQKINVRFSSAHQMDNCVIDGVRNEWTLCTSDLSTSDTVLVDNFAKMAGVSVTDKWRENVSRVITSTKHGACSRTPQVLMAILHGKWILTVDWIKACLEHGYAVDEEPYEINLDTSGVSGGPRKGRIRATKKEPKIFSGLGFCFCDQFVDQSGFLEELVVAGGGTVVSKDELRTYPVSSPESVYVVYNENSPEGCSVEDAKAIGQRRIDEVKELVVSDSRVKIVGHLWLLDTVAACDSVAYLEQGIIRY